MTNQEATMSVTGLDMVESAQQLYKEYANNLLVNMEQAGLGFNIGDKLLGTPTSADDVLLISIIETEMQQMLNLSNGYADDNDYGVHPQKSTVKELIEEKVKEMESDARS